MRVRRAQGSPALRWAQDDNAHSVRHDSRPASMASRAWSGQRAVPTNPIPCRAQLRTKAPVREVASALATSPQTLANRADIARARLGTEN